MSNSISRLPGTARQSIFYHREKAKLWAAALGLITMTCPCSKLLADVPLATPGEESVAGAKAVGAKTTKDSDFLDAITNHYAHMGQIAPSALNSTTTHLIFAMNHDNELVAKKEEEKTEESEGSATATTATTTATTTAATAAEAATPAEAAATPEQHPLIEIALPLISLEAIKAAINGMNTGIPEDVLKAMFGYISELELHAGQSISLMISHLIAIFDIKLNENQNTLMSVLNTIRGESFPVDLEKPQQVQSLAILIVSYYAALHSNKEDPELVQFFFNAFLLHAVGMSGIGRLHGKKSDLLGKDKPIDPELLPDNVEQSYSVFFAIRALEEARRDFLQQANKLLKAKKEKEKEPDDPVLQYAANLLNYGVNRNGGPLYEFNIESHSRSLQVIAEYGATNPELVASNNQFTSLIYVIGMLLDPFVTTLAQSHLNNLSSYFSEANWLGDSTEPSATENGTEPSEQKNKEETVLEIFQKVLDDAKENNGKKGAKLFGELLSSLQKYIEQQLLKALKYNEADYKVIMTTIGSGFAALLKRSEQILAIYSEQADTAESGKATQAEGGPYSDENKRKHLKDRIEALQEFVKWFGSTYGFEMDDPDDSAVDGTVSNMPEGGEADTDHVDRERETDIDESDMEESDIEESDMVDADSNKPDGGETDRSDLDD